MRNIFPVKAGLLLTLNFMSLAACAQVVFNLNSVEG